MVEAVCLSQIGTLQTRVEVDGDGASGGPAWWCSRVIRLLVSGGCGE